MKAKFNILFGVGVCALVLSAVTAQACEDVIQRFSEVAPGIYRGARPGNAGLECLAQLGIKTVVDLENNHEAVSQEMSAAHKIGIKNYVLAPMSGFFAPSDTMVDRALTAMNNKDNYPVFVHCQHGEDRTGLVVGIYRIEYEAWNVFKAYQEMLQFGFHRFLLGLKDYFKRREGVKTLPEPDGGQLPELFAPTNFQR